MTMQDLNPLRALRQAWREIETEYEDLPDEQVPQEVLRARESMEAVHELKASMQKVGAERRRLKSKAQ